MKENIKISFLSEIHLQNFCDRPCSDGSNIWRIRVAE